MRMSANKRKRRILSGTFSPQRVRYLAEHDFNWLARDQSLILKALWRRDWDSNPG